MPRCAHDSASRPQGSCAAARVAPCNVNPSTEAHRGLSLGERFRDDIHGAAGAVDHRRARDADRRVHELEGREVRPVHEEPELRTSPERCRLGGIVGIEGVHVVERRRGGRETSDLGPRRSSRVDHFCSREVDHTKNTILNRAFRRAWGKLLLIKDGEREMGLW
jgi:hypothetical protein